jgi:large subunit ribosomal protein L4
MPEAKVYDAEGRETGTRTLPDSVFGIEPNPHVLHQYVVAYLANRRQGTHSTKTRAEVRGGGAKPYRQKGTGRSRAGSIRSPVRVGGGRAFGPKSRSHRLHVNKKMRRLALRSALSDRAAEGRVHVVDGLTLDAPSTKGVKSLLESMGVSDKKRSLFLTATSDTTLHRSCRNLSVVDCLPARQANAYAVLRADHLVCTPDAVGVLEEVFG